MLNSEKLAALRSCREAMDELSRRDDEEIASHWRNNLYKYEPTLISTPSFFY